MVKKKRKTKSPKIKTDLTRTRELAVWLRSSVGKNAKVNGGHVKTVFGGHVKVRETYRIPRKYLYLNPRNHRFTTEWANLKTDRIRAKKAGEFDVTDSDDVEQIRAVIRGEIPDNKKRADSFGELVAGMRASAEEVRTTNGQEMPGVVLEDGTYVNGNRRDTALTFLTHEVLTDKKTKKTGAKTSQFSWLEVGVCQAGTTESDVRTMEIREQISRDLRDEYDFMNAAMLIKEEFDEEMLKRAKPSTKPKEKIVLRDQIISEIAADAARQKTTDVVKYLDFMDFVDQVLTHLKREGEYDLVNQSSGSEKPFSYMLKEALSIWTGKPTKTDKLDFAEDMAFEVICHQKGGKQFARGASAYRKFRSATQNKKTKPLINVARRMIKNFGNPKQAEVEKAVKKANEAVRKNELEKKTREPTEHLEEILDKILNVQTSLATGDTEKKFKVLIKQPSLVSEISTACDEIEDMIKTYRKNTKNKTRQKSSKSKSSRRRPR